MSDIALTVSADGLHAELSVSPSPALLDRDELRGLLDAMIRGLAEMSQRANHEQPTATSDASATQGQTVTMNIEQATTSVSIAILVGDQWHRYSVPLDDWMNATGWVVRQVDETSGRPPH
jgi:hypothetical protein